MPVIPRQYQDEAVGLALGDLESRYRSTLIVSATGTGKTTMVGLIANRMPAEWGRLLFVTHLRDLVYQAYEGLKAACPNKTIDIEMGDLTAEHGDGYVPASDIVIASRDSLTGRLNRYDPEAFGLIVSDECHHVTLRSKSYIPILRHFENARHLGLTATPDRADGEALGGIFEHCSFVYPMRQAIEDGYLVQPLCRAMRVAVDLNNVRRSGLDLHAGELDRELKRRECVESIIDATLQLTFHGGQERRTLIFGTSIEQARDMAACANARAPGRAVALWGAMDSDVRREELIAFSEGRRLIVCNCLDSETEILTTAGWVKEPQVAKGDITATINLFSGELEWKEATEVVRREREPGERMVAIQNQTLDIRVTEGHRMICRAPGAIGWSVQTADNLPTRVGPYQLPLAIQSPTGCGLSPMATAPPPWSKPVESLTVAECRFIGIWLADGCKDDSGGSRGVRIGQSDRYPAANEIIKQTLTECGFDWKASSELTERSPHRQNVYRIPKGNIGGSLRRRGYHQLEAYLDKEMSTHLFAMDREQFLAFLGGVWLGDGVKSEPRNQEGVSPSWTIVNSNKLMMDRLQAMATLHGFAANLSKPKDNGQLSTKPICTIVIRKRNAVTTNNHCIETSGGNPARFEEVWRPERVWCVSNENGTIVTRRNGKVVVMGQCDLFGEGYDEPRIRIVVPKPTCSRARAEQHIGRGTRVWPGVIDGEDKAGWTADQRKAAIRASEKPSCIAEGQLVLTDRGLVPIEAVNRSMRLWDGVEWVNHCGSVFQGYNNVVNYCGLEATEDHNVWTPKGWVPFRSCAYEQDAVCVGGLGWSPIREAEGLLRRDRSAPRPGVCQDCLRRMQTGVPARGQQPEAWSGWLPPVWEASAGSEVAPASMQYGEGPLRQSEQCLVQAIRRPWNPVQVRVAVGSGDVAHLGVWFHSRDGDRQDRQRRPLRAWEYPTGDSTREQLQPVSQDTSHQGGTSCFQISSPICPLCGLDDQDADESRPVMGADRRAVRQEVQQAKRRVWDILNAGPRRRFVVQGLIVSNCMVPDFYGVTSTHKLIHPVDILGGVYSTEVRERARRELKEGKGGSVTGTLEKIKAQIEAERRQRYEAILFKARVKMEAVDPFDLFDIKRSTWEPPGIRGQLATDRMIKMIERFAPDGVKIKASLSMAQGRRMIAELVKRRDAGPPSENQSRFLERRGYDIQGLTFKAASAHIEALKKRESEPLPTKRKYDDDDD